MRMFDQIKFEFLFKFPQYLSIRIIGTEFRQSSLSNDGRTFSPEAHTKVIVISFVK